VEQQDWQEVVSLSEKLQATGLELSQPVRWGIKARVAFKLEGLRERNTQIWPQDGKEMVRIPAGKFLYGPNKVEKDLSEFWIDKTPVTQAEYKRFLDANSQYPVPSSSSPDSWDQQDWSYPSDKADQPVVLVSWEDAQAYAKWAGKRLPTEEEWEKAARGTDGRQYPWGDNAPTINLCNFNKEIGGTTQVGLYSPQGDSPYGCMDMSGNVWEWTGSAEGNYKVLRGGSWYHDAASVGAASRYSDPLDARDILIGFRCVVSPGQ
jgi:serine/threonine-protein kinase